MVNAARQSNHITAENISKPQGSVVDFYQSKQNRTTPSKSEAQSVNGRKTNVVQLHAKTVKPLILELKHSVRGSELTLEEINQILDLRKQNVITGSKANAEQSRSGFLEYLNILGADNLEYENFEKDLKHNSMVILKCQGKVIAYRKVVPLEKIQDLGGHFSEICNTLKNKGVPLDKGVFSTGGCVAKGYRGKGISKLMFQELAKLTKRNYCISTIYDENESSKISQVKIGSKNLGSFKSNGKKLHIYGLNFNKVKNVDNPRLIVLNQEAPVPIAA